MASGVIVELDVYVLREHDALVRELADDNVRVVHAACESAVDIEVQLAGDAADERGLPGVRTPECHT